MSLIAHYKLDGNANDSVGGNHLTTVTALSNPSGKLGGCYDFTANQRILGSGLSFQHTVSISGWGYATSNTTNMMLFSFNSSSFSGPDLYFTNSTICWNIGDGANNPFKNNGVSVVQPSLNTWHHYVLVNDALKNKTDLYVDGVYYGTAIYRSTYQVNAGFTIGNYMPTSTGYAWRGSIDDVRIYDHALSLKEVQELAKAKVLHYTFDDFQEPTENVIANTDLMIGWSTDYNKDILQNDIAPPQGIDSQVVSFVDSDGNGNGYWFSYGDYAPQQPNTTYTISVWARTVGSDWTIRAYTADNSETGRQYTEYKTVVGNGSWQRIVFNPITTPTDTQSDSLSFQFGTIPPNQRCWLCAPQMEAKDHATPFVNGTRTGVVRDSSGQDNDATLALATTPKWVSDSRLGGGAYEFDGSGTIDGLVQGQNFSVTESITDTRNHLNGCTYSFWLNIDTDAVDRQSLFFGSSTIRHIEIYSSGKYFRTEAGITNGYSFGSSAFPDSVRGEWAHFAIVFDTGTTDQPVRWYQNGKLFSTNQLGTDYFSFNRVGRSTGTTSYAYAKSLDGKMDDLRIYATALTDEQVLELYQTRASLDDKGNFYA